MKLFINKGCNLRKINGKKILFSSKNNIFPIQINKKVVLLLLCIGEGNDVENVRQKMQTWYSIRDDETNLLLELIGAYLTTDEANALVGERYEVFYNTIKKLYKKNEGRGISCCETKKMDFMSVQVTKLCERRCIYCYAGTGKQSKLQRNDEMACDENSMDYHVFCKLIDDAKEMGIKTIELTGGDPLALHGIERYIKKVLEVGCECFVSTKQYVTEEKAKEIKKSGLHTIQVSLDSCDEEVVDRMIGCRGGFQEVVQSIRNLRNAGVEVIVKAVITSINIRQIPGLIEYCITLGVKKITFNLYGMSCGRHNIAFYAKEEEIRWLTTEIISAREHFGSEIFIEYPELYIEQFMRTNSRCLEYKHYYRSVCNPLSTSVFVLSNGDVPYCSYLATEESMLLGNVKKKNLGDILKSDKLKKLKAPNRELYENTECYNCENFYTCFKRRCHFRTFIANGKVYEKDPWCKYGDENFKEY